MTSYDLWLEPEVHHARKDLPGNFRQQVKHAIDHLATDPRPLNQVYATESLALDPEWKATVAALLADEGWLGSTTLKDYAELYNIPLDAEAYRREFPEDEPFTHPPTDEE